MCARAGSALRLDVGSYPIGGHRKVDTAGDEVVEVRLSVSGKRSPLSVRTTETGAHTFRRRHQLAVISWSPSRRPSTASAGVRRPGRRGPASRPFLSRASAGAQTPRPPATRTVGELAVRAHCFASAGVPLALLHEAHLSSAVKRLAVRAHRLAVAGLRSCRTDREACNQRR
jgi:hypothetical protein